MVDECSISTTQYGYAAIDANVMHFNQSVLKVYGSGQVASSTNKYGGRGINLGSALYVNGGQLYTYGGSGINNTSNNGTGYRGALGGDGLMAYYVYMNNDGKLFCFGGDGGNGGSGAAGGSGGIAGPGSGKAIDLTGVYQQTGDDGKDGSHG